MTMGEDITAQAAGVERMMEGDDDIGVSEGDETGGL
jgi:hypothetical protein